MRSRLGPVGAVICALATGCEPPPGGVAWPPAQAPAASPEPERVPPSAAPRSPEDQLEALVRAHLGDLELRTCLSQAYATEHLERLQVEIKRDDAGKPVLSVDATDLAGTDKISSCLNRLLISWLPWPAPPTATITFVLTSVPGQAALAYQRVRDIPRVEPALAGTLALAGGSLGGSGFRDGPARAARFDFPLGIAADGAGHLLVADANNRAIRRVDLVTGDVQTALAVPAWVAVTEHGSSFQRHVLEQPSSLQIDRAGRRHVLDALHDDIWRIDDGKLTQVYIGKRDTPAALSGPRAMVFDRDGTVLVADSGHNRIVRIDLATGALTDVAGERGKAGHRDGARPLFDHPEGLALDDAGHLFVADWGSHTIREITLATGQVRTLAGRNGGGGHADGVGAAARFDNPSSLVHDRGELYVAESTGNVIRRVRVATREVTTLAGSYRASGSADGIGAAARFNHHWDAGVGELPFGLVIADGQLYLSDTGNHAIRRITVATGAVTTLAGRARDDALPRPRAIAFAADGQLYATAGQALYRLVDGAAQLVAGDRARAGHDDGIATRARFKGPVALGGAPDGSLIVGDVNGEVRRVDPRTGKVKTLFDSGHILNTLTVDARGNIYVGELGRIVRISPAGKPTVLVSWDARRDPHAVIAPIRECVGLAIDGDTLYVLGEASHSYYKFPGIATTLRRFDLAAGTHETLATWAVEGAGFSAGLALDHGVLWIIHGNGVVARFDPRTGHERAILAAAPSSRGVTLGPAPQINAPAMPTIAPGGDLVFIDEGAVLRLHAP